MQKRKLFQQIMATERKGPSGLHPGAPRVRDRRAALVGPRCKVIVAIGIAALSIAASAQSNLQGGPITAAEWTMLPEYCVDTQGFKYGRGKSPNSEKWVSMMGETFWSLHHYCLGIVKFNRAQRFGTPDVIRRGFLSGALGEFRFVTEKMPEGYVLAPEIFTYVGRTYLLLDQPPQAEAAFGRARSAKKDYWPAYSWWATYLANHGKAADALHVATEGLSYAPQSRPLQLLVRELRGKDSKVHSEVESGPKR
jgi:hypothetical protein